MNLEAALIAGIVSLTSAVVWQTMQLKKIQGERVDDLKGQTEKYEQIVKSNTEANNRLAAAQEVQNAILNKVLNL